MKTLKNSLKNADGKVVTEYFRVKESDIKSCLSKGFKYSPKVEWKIATKGYGKKSVKKVEEKKVEDVTEGLSKKPYQKPKRS